MTSFPSKASHASFTHWIYCKGSITSPWKLIPCTDGDRCHRAINIAALIKDSPKEDPLQSMQTIYALQYTHFQKLCQYLLYLLNGITPQSTSRECVNGCELRTLGQWCPKGATSAITRSYWQHIDRFYICPTKPLRVGVTPSAQHTVKSVSVKVAVLFAVVLGVREAFSD